MSIEAVREIQELQEKTGLTSRADVIRYALRFFQWTVDELTDDGNPNLCIEKNGEMRQLVLPFIQRRKT